MAKKANPNKMGIYSHSRAGNKIYTYQTKDDVKDMAYMDYFMPMFEHLEVGDRIQVFIESDDKKIERYQEYIIVDKDEANKKLYKFKIVNRVLDIKEEDNLEEDGV